MQVQLYNSLTREKEIFESLEKGKVKIYSCGPTVYASPHIGNFRAFIFADILRRTFEFLDYQVIQVMNITDVGHLTSDSSHGEDKLEKGAKASGKTVWQVADYYITEFKDALLKLNIETPTYLPRATEHIQEQIDLIKKLTEKGFTYEISDGIYFDTSKFKKYGKLSGQNLEDKEAGARVEVKSEKRHPADFALWKFCVGENANHTMKWDYETGTDLSKLEPKTYNLKPRVGFPGWHIECSAMSMRYLGETLDIHTGGVDHIPVHHENEIAQSEAATDKKFVNYWLHNEFLTIDGGKMSKSLGNLFTVKDLADKGFDPLAFRYLCLEASYRKKLNFTWEALRNSAKALANLREIYQTLSAETEPGEAMEVYLSQFAAALGDDLNTPQALAVVWQIAKDERISLDVKLATLTKCDLVLGLKLGQVEQPIELSVEQKKLLQERAQARTEKNWKRSDELREEFLRQGLEVEDTAQGQVVKKKP